MWVLALGARAGNGGGRRSEVGEFKGGVAWVGGMRRSRAKVKADGHASRLAPRAHSWHAFVPVGGWMLPARPAPPSAPNNATETSTVLQSTLHKSPMFLLPSSTLRPRPPPRPLQPRPPQPPPRPLPLPRRPPWPRQRPSSHQRRRSTPGAPGGIRT